MSKKIRFFEKIGFLFSFMIGLNVTDGIATGITVQLKNLAREIYFFHA
jgi:hypothetical protein